MEAETAAPAPVADTAPVDSAPVEAAAPADEVVAATPEDAGRRNPATNKYNEEVNNLLTAYDVRDMAVSALATLSTPSATTRWSTTW